MTLEMLPMMSVVLYSAGAILIPGTLGLASWKRSEVYRDTKDEALILDSFIRHTGQALRRRWKHPYKVMKTLSKNWTEIPPSVQDAIRQSDQELTPLKRMLEELSQKSLPDQVEDYRVLSVFGFPMLELLFREGLHASTFAVRRFSLIGLLRMSSFSDESRMSLAEYANASRNLQEAISVASHCLQGRKMISMSTVQAEFGFSTLLVLYVAEKLRIPVSDLANYHQNPDPLVRKQVIRLYEVEGRWPAGGDVWYDDSDAQVRTQAIQSCPNHSLHKWYLSLFDVSENVRLAAAKRLMDMAGAKGVEQIHQAFSCEAPSTQTAILRVFMEGLYADKWMQQEQNGDLEAGKKMRWMESILESEKLAVRGLRDIAQDKAREGIA